MRIKIDGYNGRSEAGPPEAKSIAFEFDETTGLWHLRADGIDIAFPNWELSVGASALLSAVEQQMKNHNNSIVTMRRGFKW